MEQLKVEHIAVACPACLDILNEKNIRILDESKHFLGKILEGRVYIYCKKCKRFALVHKH